MKKHTPGPWTKSVAPTRFNIHAPSFHKLATAFIRPEGGSMDEIEANARLIAAAPTLLAALKEAENALADYVPTLEKQGAMMGYGSSVLKIVRETIAKAEEQTTTA